MKSDFTEQYFGGNKNWVNAKFKIVLNHSSLIIMLTSILCPVFPTYMYSVFLSPPQRPQEVGEKIEHKDKLIFVNFNIHPQMRNA